jgi:hypothetical protein
LSGIVACGSPEFDQPCRIELHIIVGEYEQLTVGDLDRPIQRNRLSPLWHRQVSDVEERIRFPADPLRSLIIAIVRYDDLDVDIGQPAPGQSAKRNSQLGWPIRCCDEYRDVQGLSGHGPLRSLWVAPTHGVSGWILKQEQDSRHSTAGPTGGTKKEGPAEAGPFVHRSRNGACLDPPRYGVSIPR